MEYAIFTTYVKKFLATLFFIDLKFSHPMKRFLFFSSTPSCCRVLKDRNREKYHFSQKGSNDLFINSHHNHF